MMIKLARACVCVCRWVAQYGASALWHVTPWQTRSCEIWANHCDHVGIFLMIAGSYMVPCALALPETGGFFATGLWSVALLGSLKTLNVGGPFKRGGRKSLAIMYVSMGGMVSISLREMCRTFTPTEAALGVACVSARKGETRGGRTASIPTVVASPCPNTLLLSSSVCQLSQYLFSAVVYANKWGDFNPKHWGYHESFHLLVCSGGTCCYFACLSIVKRDAATALGVQESTV